MDIFELCHQINDRLIAGNETEARNELIKLLDYHEKQGIAYSPLVNHLIRSTGLYPYMMEETSTWQDRWIHDLFKVDVGGNKITLHREQSLLLKHLLDGKNLAVSAPTSFGKSFVVDAFISIKSPTTVVIIVPTIALTDETRRRVQKKFGSKYKIITTPEIELSENNIFIFPQERAISYLKKLKEIDILIIDEFYKASVNFGKERAPILLKSILELGRIAKQKYFLAPNISSINESPFTADLQFVSIDFNTVFTEKHDTYKEINSKDNDIKGIFLMEILERKKTKTLIYAGTYNNIDFIANIFDQFYDNLDSQVLNDFSLWLQSNYGPDYILARLVKKGVGIHNGQLHRSLSQIQVRLFEEIRGLQNIISTSSIIEGVNTSAENVIIWANKDGKPPLNDFTYRNIVGRGGRMFKHFIGKVYLLEPPPASAPTQLSLHFTDELLNSIDEEKYEKELTREQIIKIIAFKDEMNTILGDNVYNQMVKENVFQSFNPDRIKNIAYDMYKNPTAWSGLGYLNSDIPSDWESKLFKVLEFTGSVGAMHRDMVAFIKAISQNWHRPIPEIIKNLRSNGVTIEKFFELERIASFKIASLLSDINQLQRRILKSTSTDISPFIAKLSHAFLPTHVYTLEEYGLPRMISKKIHQSELINLESSGMEIHEILKLFKEIGQDTILNKTKNLLDFDRYIINYFYEGITSAN